MKLPQQINLKKKSYTVCILILHFQELFVYVKSKNKGQHNIDPWQPRSVQIYFLLHNAHGPL